MEIRFSRVVSLHSCGTWISLLISSSSVSHLATSSCASSTSPRTILCFHLDSLDMSYDQSTKQLFLNDTMMLSRSYIRRDTILAFHVQKMGACRCCFRAYLFIVMVYFKAPVRACPPAYLSISSHRLYTFKVSISFSKHGRRCCNRMASEICSSNVA